MHFSNNNKATKQPRQQQQTLKSIFNNNSTIFVKKTKHNKKLIVFSDDVEELVTKDGEKERETKDWYFENAHGQYYLIVENPWTGPFIF